MDASSPDPSPPQFSNTRLGIILRVAFFVAVVAVSLRLLTVSLYTLFGALVAATLSLSGTGLLANLLTMRIFDRRPFVDIGLHGGPASGRNLLIGIVFGAGAAALMLAAPLIAGTGHLIARNTPSADLPEKIWFLGAVALGAAGEEFIFRGYAFQLLIQKIGPFATILPVSVIFGLAHASNPNASALGVFNTTLWGILLGYAFLRSRDLWLPIGIHFGWNAVLPMFGVNLSGLTIDVTRYFYKWDLLPLWSGGAYGPEGGLLTTIFVIALFFALMRAPVFPQRAAIAECLND
jgi:membrane protease YdiL (CAAX protease family)